MGGEREVGGRRGGVDPLVVGGSEKGPDDDCVLPPFVPQRKTASKSPMAPQRRDD